jgi:hypothetical protein
MKRVLLVIWSLLILLPPVVAQDYYSVRKQTRISTGLDEAAAVPYEDGVVYITETNNVGASSPTDPQGRKLFSIFILENGGRKKPFREDLVTRKHDGPVSFTRDNKTMVYSQQRPSVGRVDPLGLYFADNVDGEWVNERAFEYNDDVAWLFSPSISEDGQTLYFSANYENSLGGFDIYRSQLKGGAWTKPENLGPRVNTPGNEIYPFIHPSGKLYFSSDGHDNNVAGFDLFQTALVDGKWARAVKLGAPFNTLSNDYHIWFSEDFKSGYLTSDRRSGSKDIYTFNTDIPVFESPEPIRRTYYKYHIFDKKLDTVDTNLFRYSWVINDTLEVPGYDIIYKFPKPGKYHCVLHVFDIQLDTLLEPETYKDLTIKLNEQAVITCPDTITVNTPVRFDGSETYLPGFNIGRYLWEFGDGTFGEGMEVTHTYLYPGKYTVMLGVEERKVNRRDTPDVRANYKDVVVISPGQ